MIKLLLKVNELGVSTSYNASRITVTPVGAVYYQIELNDEQFSREVVDHEQEEIVVLKKLGMKSIIRGLLGAIIPDADESF